MQVKQLKRLVLSLGLATATTLFLAGCGPGSHAGHDHDHDHAGHDHADHDHGTASSAGDAVVQAVTGKVAEGAALVIVEEPTAEQLAVAKPYPLETCLVAGEKLGEMGEPLVVLVGNQQVKLCCAQCLPDLKEKTAEMLAKLGQ